MTECNVEFYFLYIWYITEIEFSWKFKCIKKFKCYDRKIIWDIKFRHQKHAKTLKAEGDWDDFFSSLRSSHTPFSLLFFSSRLVLSCSSVSSCLTAYLEMTSSRRDRATSLFDLSFRSSEGSNRAGSVALEGGGEKRQAWWMMEKEQRNRRGQERRGRAIS